MTTFQETKEHAKEKVIVHLLSEIERNPALTQRKLAAELGIALGLINHYLKRCITKGWIRAAQVSPKRIKYFVTPEGFREKSLMVSDYLARSLTFFRDARKECEYLYTYCQKQGWMHLALIGHGDLCDIALLLAHGTNLLIDVVKPDDNLSSFDAVLITDIITPQATYDTLSSHIEEERLLTFDLLHISRRPIEAGSKYHP